MRVLLVLPTIKEEVTGIFERAGGITMPLCIAYLAAYLKQHGYKDIYALDNWIEKLTDEQVRERIKDIKPDIVGVSTATPNFYNAVAIAKIAKELNPKVKIVFGGAHVTYFQEKILNRYPALIDAICVGEGEQTLLELVGAWKKNEPLDNIRGLIFLKNSQVFKTPPRGVIGDLDNLPFPARELFPIDKYFLPLTRKKIDAKGDVIMISRGCPNRCAFCAKPMWGRTIRLRGAKNVVAEVEYIMKNYGVREILFQDSNFSVNRKLAWDITQLFIDKKLNIAWTAQSRVDCLDEELIKHYKESGCELLALGIESGNQQILDNICKDTTLEQAENAVRWCKKYKIDTVCAFMFGNPGETKETAWQTIRFAQKLAPTFPIFFILVPNPGSPIYIEAVKKGILKDEDFMDVGGLTDYSNVSDQKPIFAISDLLPDDLIRFQKLGYRKLYLNPKSILKRISQIRSRESIKRLFLGGLTVLRHQLNKYDK